MPGQVPLQGGPDVDEEKLDGTVLLGPEEDVEVAGDSVSSEEEDGPGPPPCIYFLVFCSPLVPPMSL